MLRLWFFLLVQELFEEQLGLQQRLCLGLGLGRMQEGRTGVRSGPHSPQGGMPGGLQGHVSSQAPAPSCRHCQLFPAHILTSRLWEEARRGQAAGGKTGVGEQELCLVAAWAGGGRPIPNPSVFPELLGHGSGQS